MIIERLRLKHFRNYGSLDLDFSPGYNIITGPNGTGKTNILEAISVLSGVKSFRNVRDIDIIQWGHDSYYCSCTIGNSEHREYEIGCANVSEKIKKRAKIDGNEITSLSGYLGKLLTVVFSPSDINIINGTPDQRRRFFDSIIARFDCEYLNHLTDFRRVLHNRNRVLKSMRNEIREGKDLDVWDELFAVNSSVLTKKRLEFLERFYPIFKSIYAGIISIEAVPAICYTGKWEFSDREYILQKLYESRKRDIIAGTSCFGPHRDDYPMMYTSDCLFCAAGSQGQKRTAAIALRLAECSILEESTGKRVIIMVDDIFSELDRIRRENMFGILDRDNQVIFTMVEPLSVPKEKDTVVTRFICEGGVVKTMQ